MCSEYEAIIDARDNFISFYLVYICLKGSSFKFMNLFVCLSSFQMPQYSENLRIIVLRIWIKVFLCYSFPLLSSKINPSSPGIRLISRTAGNSSFIFDSSNSRSLLIENANSSLIYLSLNLD